VRPLELWGGIECTVNRVANTWFNQLELGGHAHRLEDLDRLASLGIRTVRYPLLWELHAPASGSEIDWTWADDRLNRLCSLGIKPILGLVHHGSGPSHTSLIDEGFAAALADYAGKVAARFPWVQWYTPINEPLTTARFSGLYGLWYPHGRDDVSFARALVNQCCATVLAMQAIRRVNPGAKLLQTEDLGTTYHTPGMSYQAQFDNERRWIGWDLLCGRVDRGHALWAFLLESGIGAGELEWLCANPCPPDMIGINHYVTSDRFLDEDWARYPSQHWGSNAHQRYADLDAVRILQEPPERWQALLELTWARYQLPLALSEVHLGCTREEQLRWLHQAWGGAQATRAAGVDVRAVTSWALFGSFNWNTLLTCCDGHYEPGAFDVRAPQPRPTALSRLVNEITGGKPGGHAVLDDPGWWDRPQRLLIQSQQGALSDSRHSRARPVMICGATGTLGRAFVRACEARGLAHRAFSRLELDICDAVSVAAALDEVRPWCIVNAAGFSAVDDAENAAARCRMQNTQGPETLAFAAGLRSIPLLTFSSDLVFDGRTDVPYVESSVVSPLSEFGRSKAAAEASVLKLHPGALCVRTAARFDPTVHRNFLTHALTTLASGRSFTACDDVIVSPTYAPDLVHASLDLLIDGESGIWHLINDGAVSGAELITRAADALGVGVTRLEKRTCASYQFAAARPLFSALRSERGGALLPSLEDALSRYTQALRPAILRS
jgi:dTDP-4-dehydrorhamnose reductase